MRWLALLLLCGCVAQPVTSQGNPEQVDQLTAVYREGARAERLSINAEANPHSPGTTLRYKWHAGFMDSREKRWKAMGYDKD